MSKFAAFILLLATSCYLSAQASTDKLLQEAQQAPTLEKNLRVLTDEFGGRVPGTPAMTRAVQWGLSALFAFALVVFNALIESKIYEKT